MSYISGGTLEGVLRLSPPTTTPAVSAAGTGRIYYDSVDNKFKVSENGAAYADLAGGSTPSLADVLAVGNTTGGNGIVVTANDTIRGEAATGANDGGSFEVYGGASVDGESGSITIDAGAVSGTGGGGGIYIGDTNASELLVQRVLFTSDGSEQRVAGYNEALWLTAETHDEDTAGKTVFVWAGDANGAADGGTLHLRAGHAGEGVFTGGSVLIEAAGGDTPGDIRFMYPASEDVMWSMDGAFGGGGAPNLQAHGGEAFILGAPYSEAGTDDGWTLRIYGGDRTTTGSGTGGSLILGGGYSYNGDGGPVHVEGGPGGGEARGGSVYIDPGAHEGDSTLVGAVYISTLLAEPGHTSALNEVVIGNPDNTNQTVTIHHLVADNIASSGDVQINLNYTPAEPGYPPGMWVLAPVGEAIYLGSGTILVEGDGTNNRIYGKPGSTGSGDPGEQLWLAGGSGDGVAAGGLLRLEGGTGGANGNGAAVSIAAGAGGSSSGDGGSISISAGSTTDGEGGGVSITGGGGTGGFDGGDISITGGANGGGAAEPGAVVIAGGGSGSGGFSGGTLSLLGGNNTSAGPGGSVTLRGGTGSTGGQTLVTGGHGNATGTGGALNLYSGNGGSTSGNSGAVNLDVGSVVSGTAGTISVGTTRATALTIGRAGVTSTIAGVADLTGATNLGAIATVSGNTTLDATYSNVLVDASGGTVTLTLPAAASSTRRVYTIKKIDNSVNAVVIDGDSGETIDGAATVSLVTQYESIRIVCNGTSWFIM